MDVRTGPGQHFVFTLETDENVSPGTLAFSLPQRKWATLSLNQEIDVTPYQFSPDKHYLSSIVLEVDFFNKKNTSTDPFNSDDMAKEFSMQFCKQVLLGGKHWAMAHFIRSGLHGWDAGSLQLPGQEAALRGCQGL